MSGYFLNVCGDRADGVGPRVHQFGRAELAGGDDARAELHLAVRQRRAVLDDEHALAGDALRVVHHDRRGGLDDDGGAVDAPDVGAQRVDGGDVGGVHLVDDDDVRHPQVGLAGVVGQLVPDAQRVRDDDVEVGLVERRVVVAAVPQDDVRLLLRLRQDVAVVDAGVDDRAADDVRLVLLDLLDRAVVLLEVGDRRRSAGRAASRGCRTASGGGWRPPSGPLRGGSRRCGAWSGSCPSPCGRRRRR